MGILDEKSGTEPTELEKLQAENAALKAKLESGKTKGEGITVQVIHGGICKEYNLGLKVSEKGAVSIYGTGRFPVTMYALVLRAILASAPEIEAFIKKNDEKLSWAKAEKA